MVLLPSKDKHCPNFAPGILIRGGGCPQLRQRPDGQEVADAVERAGAWVLCSGRHTVTRMIETISNQALKDSIERWTTSSDSARQHLRQAHLDSFDLHADAAVGADDHQRVERPLSLPRESMDMRVWICLTNGMYHL